MAIFNYAAREMTAKIVYYGPGLSGKTTSIQLVHTRISPKNKGKLVSLATETDRTLFFDFFPVEFGQIGGFKVKFNFYTVPGQVFYNTTRKLVLKGADGVVFVADSQPGMMEQNLESLANLKENLKAHGIEAESVPFVIQYNKRDIPGAQSVEEMRRLLNPQGVPDFETCATTGEGVMEAMKAICRMVLEELQRKQRGAAPQAARPLAPQEEPEPAAGGEFRIGAASVGGEPVSARAPGIERSIALAIRGPGSHTITVGVPLDLQLEAGVEGVRVTVDVHVAYRGGRGQVLVRELLGDARPPQPAAVESPTAPPAKRAGFFARLFGKG